MMLWGWGGQGYIISSFDKYNSSTAESVQNGHTISSHTGC